MLHSVLQVACDKEPSLPLGGPVRAGKPHICADCPCLCLRPLKGKEKKKNLLHTLFGGKSGRKQVSAVKEIFT